jgi:hypothetical protein
MRRLFLIIAILMLFPFSHAATVNCAANATSCITGAASGDTVNVAAGSASWTITITKAIYLHGAGSGSTIITGGIVYSPTAAEASKVFEVDGFTFQGTGTHVEFHAPSSSNPITGIKIHNNVITGASSRAVIFHGYEAGVFYSNTFSNNYISVSGIGPMDYWTNLQWDYNWVTGNANYIYFEDNTFGACTGAGWAAEGGQSSRWALRHNSVTGCSGADIFDMHGEQNTSGWTISAILTDNNITTNGASRLTTWRGGQAIIANNTSNGSSYQMTEYYAWGGNTDHACHPYPVGFNSSEAYCSPINGTSCVEEQIHNSFFFNNKISGSQSTPQWYQTTNYCGGTPSSYIQENREYWVPTSGLASALPATCTADGNTYYGATDTDQIWKCTSTNTWTIAYQPYPYPHPLRAGGTAPAVSLAWPGSPATLTFNARLVGTTSTAQDITLTNSGTAALTMTSVTLTGTNAADYSISANTCTGSIAALGTCTISVKFSPLATGARTANVSIADNASDSPQIVPMTGTGTAPAVSLNPTSLTFAAQTLNTTSTSQAITLTNTGNGGLTINSIAPSGDYAQTNTCGTLPASVGPGNNCVINVTFTPTATGTRNGTIVINDTANGSPHTATLTGTGTGVISPGSLMGGVLMGGLWAPTGGGPGPGPGPLAQGENTYCTAGTGVEKTEGTPTWGTTDGVAALPTQCMNTAMASTPSPGSTIVADTAAAFTAALASVTCGQTIQLTAGSTYTGQFTLPALSCTGANWITIKSSGVSDPNFPPEGTRVTPCISNIASEPGYPYSCPTPRALTAKIVANTGTGAIKFATGANHYRLIGLEITKVADLTQGKLIRIPPDSDTLGSNHIVLDRLVIHGQPWNLTTTTAAETGGGIDANNSTWVASINSWNYDTYCMGSPCADSQGFSSSTGGFASGPFKLYNNLIASSGESWMLGGGGKGIGTPNSDNIEIRANHSFKPLVWMIPIETGSIYAQTTVKNLGEFKAGTHVLIEGNVFENNWQGQSDQTGYGLLLDPRNQNNKANITVTFSGNTVTRDSPGITGWQGQFVHTCGLDPNCRPDDAANCPPAGCILEVSGGPVYRFCNGSNGCSQDGDPAVTGIWKLTATPTPASAVQAYTCVPGDCPSCRVNNVIVRHNEIINVINGMEINTALSSHCKDEAKELAKVEIHDNILHGFSSEMSNGSDWYSQSAGFVLGNGQIASIINAIEIAHNTVAIENGSEMTGFNAMGGLGQQVDYTDLQYLQGFNIHDNVGPAAWHVNHSNGSLVTNGVGGASGLANTYQTDSCKAYYPVDGGGVVVDGTANADVAAHTAFTFSPSLASFMVTKNGSNALVDSSTSTGFTLTGTLVAGDAITVRDLNTCDWHFTGNILGTGLPGNLHVNDESPYPTGNTILDGSAFTSIFANWQDRTGGNYTITNATYKNNASDAANRGATGKDPGADISTWSSLITGVRMAMTYPALSITSGTLTAATHGVAYNYLLVASAGASPYKSWWLETNSANCGGNCGSITGSGIILGRSGTVGGPFIVLTAVRAAGVSTFTPKQTMTGGTWAVGQVITMTGFVNGKAPNEDHDAEFNGNCTITAITTNNFSCAQTGATDIASHSPTVDAFTFGTTLTPYHYALNQYVKDGGLFYRCILAYDQGPTTGDTTEPGKGSNWATYWVQDATIDGEQYVSFAPITPGTYTFWIGARDGAFQIARKQITVTVN